MLQSFRSLGRGVSLQPLPPLPLRSLIEKDLPGLGCGPSSSPQPHPTGLSVERPSLSLWAWWGTSQSNQQPPRGGGGPSLPASMSPLFGLRGTLTGQPLPLHLVGAAS